MGLATAALMFWIIGGFRPGPLWEVAQLTPTIPIAAAVVLACAWYLGGPIGRLIAGGSGWTAAWSGGILGISCLMLGAAVGSAVYLVTEWKRYDPSVLLQVLVKGPLAIGLYGFVPAVALGLGCGWSIRRITSSRRGI